eukprot:TRINITY_DN1237_c5_g1_i1.p1 TRINITY_DN1237_c5_g1~~TRINITY_DN1237_c5_g1_i1.p1  ORF type:complete len:559 (+),score=193.14 TRINITY_DN1237_c5_g1_i1:491-2167(+)
MGPSKPARFRLKQQLMKYLLARRGSAPKMADVVTELIQRQRRNSAIEMSRLQIMEAQKRAEERKRNLIPQPKVTPVVVKSLTELNNMKKSLAKNVPDTVPSKLILKLQEGNGVQAGQKKNNTSVKVKAMRRHSAALHLNPESLAKFQQQQHQHQQKPHQNSGRKNSGRRESSSSNNVNMTPRGGVQSLTPSYHTRTTPALFKTSHQNQNKNLNSHGSNQNIACEDASHGGDNFEMKNDSRWEVELDTDTGDSTPQVLPPPISINLPQEIKQSQLSQQMQEEEEEHQQKQNQQHQQHQQHQQQQQHQHHQLSFSNPNNNNVTHSKSASNLALPLKNRGLIPKNQHQNNSLDPATSLTLRPLSSRRRSNISSSTINLNNGTFNKANSQAIGSNQNRKHSVVKNSNNNNTFKNQQNGHNQQSASSWEYQQFQKQQQRQNSTKPLVYQQQQQHKHSNRYGNEDKNNKKKVKSVLGNVLTVKKMSVEDKLATSVSVPLLARLPPSGIKKSSNIKRKTGRGSRSSKNGRKLNSVTSMVEIPTARRESSTTETETMTIRVSQLGD